jgi:hypothetical protein
MTTSVYDANGNLLPGAMFTGVGTPEGPTASLMILGLLLILVRMAAPQRRHLTNALLRW